MHNFCLPQVPVGGLLNKTSIEIIKLRFSDVSMSFLLSFYLNDDVSNIETLDNSNFIISILLSALMFGKDHLKKHRKMNNYELWPYFVGLRT